jgi:hypothetical protein
MDLSSIGKSEKPQPMERVGGPGSALLAGTARMALDERAQACAASMTPH